MPLAFSAFSGVFRAICSPEGGVAAGGNGKFCSRATGLDEFKEEDGKTGVSPSLAATGIAGGDEIVGEGGGASWAKPSQVQGSTVTAFGSEFSGGFALVSGSSSVDSSSSRTSAKDSEFWPPAGGTARFFSGAGAIGVVVQGCLPRAACPDAAYRHAG